MYKQILIHEIVFLFLKMFINELMNMLVIHKHITNKTTHLLLAIIFFFEVKF